MLSKTLLIEYFSWIIHSFNSRLVDPTRSRKWKWRWKQKRLHSLIFTQLKRSITTDHNMAFHPEWQGNKMTNPKTDNHCILAGNCLELSLIINVTESSNAAMISRKDSRDQRFRQSGADMLFVNYWQYHAWDESRKKTKRDNNSLTALTDTDISSDNCYFSPLSGLRVVCDTDIDNDWCHIPFSYHPIIPSW